VVANATESLYSMINLDRVQDSRPLHLTHPTPCRGRFSRRRWQSARNFLFYAWQYDIRWAPQMLRDGGQLMPADQVRGESGLLQCLSVGDKLGQTRLPPSLTREFGRPT